MSDLVQIKPAPIPALHQSTESVMSCAYSYVEIFIKGRKQPGGLDSARGRQVHHTLSEYASWCAHKGVAADYDAFDRFAKGAGLAATKILSGLKEGYIVDFENLLATEIMLSLDEDFRPTNPSMEVDGLVQNSGRPAAYEGILDLLLTFRSFNKAQIDDAKTHPKPFDPDDTLQGKMYSLFVFQHFPWVQEVLFRLIFVRYRNLTRQVTYTRADLPMLIETVRSARSRQIKIHEDWEAGRDIEATAGPHCNYCPLLSDRSCPIAEFNPNMELSLQDRVNWLLWDAAFRSINSQVLRNHIQATGRKIILLDHNGKKYTYGPVEREAKVYPLFQPKPNGKGFMKDHNDLPVLPIVELLMDHAHSTPDDVDWFSKLTISSSKLDSYLNAQSRADLDQAVSDTSDHVTKVRMAISKPLETLDDEPEIDEDEDDFEEGGF